MQFEVGLTGIVTMTRLSYTIQVLGHLIHSLLKCLRRTLCRRSSMVNEKRRSVAALAPQRQRHRPQGLLPVRAAYMHHSASSETHLSLQSRRFAQNRAKVASSLNWSANKLPIMSHCPDPIPGLYRSVKDG